MNTKAFSAFIIVFPEHFYDTSKNIFQSVSCSVAKEKCNQFCGLLFSGVLGRREADDLSAGLGNWSPVRNWERRCGLSKHTVIRAVVLWCCYSTGANEISVAQSLVQHSLSRPIYFKCSFACKLAGERSLHHSRAIKYVAVIQIFFNMYCNYPENIWGESILNNNIWIFRIIH